MRGRWQALAIAVLGAGSVLFGWISAAAVALVTLRKGVRPGIWLMFWALLPAAVATYVTGDAGNVLLLTGTFALALLLRISVSLALAVLASVVVGLLTGGSLLLFSADFLAQIAAVFAELLQQVEAGLQQPGAAPVNLRAPTVAQLVGIFAAGNAMMSVLSLLLARYWQSALYNPGGFGTEFRTLRLPMAAALGLAAMAVALWSLGPDYAGWAVLAAVPLTFWGFALVHANAHAKGRGKAWLILFYMLWLLIDPAKMVLLAVVVADTFIDFRARWQMPPGGGSA
ncbi:hypothetical protein [Luminiphilus syltensis]|nr:hypothetical protein [Luminiphilus syltensis]